MRKFIKKKNGKVLINPGRQGKVITLKDGNMLRLHKAIPKGCSTPRCICIKCLTSVIHKNDLNYDSKICKGCS